MSIVIVGCGGLYRWDGSQPGGLLPSSRLRVGTFGRKLFSLPCAPITTL
jgi:hypothetical protein